LDSTGSAETDALVSLPAAHEADSAAVVVMSVAATRRLDRFIVGALQNLTPFGRSDRRGEPARG
jgi:hypothetical protein